MVYGKSDSSSCVLVQCLARQRGRQQVMCTRSVSEREAVVTPNSIRIVVTNACFMCLTDVIAAVSELRLAVSVARLAGRN